MNKTRGELVNSKRSGRGILFSFLQIVFFLICILFLIALYPVIAGIFNVWDFSGIILVEMVIFAILFNGISFILFKNNLNENYEKLISSLGGKKIDPPQRYPVNQEFLYKVAYYCKPEYKMPKLYWQGEYNQNYVQIEEVPYWRNKSQLQHRNSFRVLGGVNFNGVIIAGCKTESTGLLITGALDGSVFDFYGQPLEVQVMGQNFMFFSKEPGDAQRLLNFFQQKEHVEKLVSFFYHLVAGGKFVITPDSLSIRIEHNYLTQKFDPLMAKQIFDYLIYFRYKMKAGL